MSVNLHLSITIRDYDPHRAEEIQQAVRELVEHEQLETDLPPLAEAEDDGVKILTSRTDPDSPVVVSSAYSWAPAFNDRVREAVWAANKGQCEAVFEWEDSDEDVPDYEPE